MIRFSVCVSLLRRQAAVLGGVGAAFLFASSVRAADLDFNVANGNFTTAGNWVDATTGAAVGAAPTLGDNAFVRNGGTVTIDSDVAATLIRIGASKTIQTGEPPVDTAAGGAGTLIWTAGEITGVEGFHQGGPDLRVGQRINPGGTLVPAGADYPGTVTQNGATTKIMLKNPESRITIGDNGATSTPPSSYTLINGTIGTAIGGSGIDGANGNNGINVKNGTFTMTGGQIIDATPDDLKAGTLTTQRFLTIASNTGTGLGSENVATATLSGGSINVLGGIRVASSGNTRGYLNINGPITIVTGGDTSIGYNAVNGWGEMNMSAGSLQVGRNDTNPISGAPYNLLGRLQIGHRGKGVLNMSGGSIDVSREIRVGAENAAGGSVINMTGGTILTPALNMRNDITTGTDDGASIIIDGASASFSQIGAAGTIIGNQGKALFEVRQGTAVLGRSGTTTAGFVNVGATAASKATVNLKGGKLSLGGTMGYTYAASITPGFTYPDINLTGGTLEFNNPLGTSALSWQPHLENEGSTLSLKPGALQQVNIGQAFSAETQTQYASNFSMTSGVFDVEIGAHTLLGADFFSVANGTASLTGGSVNISYLPGFTPNDGDTMKILRASAGVTLNAGAVTITGSNAANWSLITALSGGVQEIQLKYTASVGVAGDYNGNGVVDGADYVLWRNGGALQNDPNPGNPTAQYSFWRSRFGATSGSGSGVGLGSSAVPEPSSVVLVMLSFVALLGAKRAR